MSRYLIDQIARLANVRVLLGTEVTELLGDRELEATRPFQGLPDGAKRVEGQPVSGRSCHSKCHSRQVRYSVLCSKKRRNLEPPYGIEP
jgi:hypothetical protein